MELGCNGCVCETCLFHESVRCPYGECRDSIRASTNPYDKEHPGVVRKAWSNWEQDQAYWCRGGISHWAFGCEKYVPYEREKHKVLNCFSAVVDRFHDGYIRCPIVDSVGCEECIKRYKEQRRNKANGI